MNWFNHIFLFYISKSKLQRQWSITTEKGPDDFTSKTYIYSADLMKLTVDRNTI